MQPSRYRKWQSSILPCLQWECLKYWRFVLRYLSFTSCTTITISGRFVSWVMRIAHNLIIDHFRRQQGEKVGKEFFDRQKDPNETLNLIDNIEYTRQIHLQLLAEVA